MKCPSCGIYGYGKFCSHCGEPLDESVFHGHGTKKTDGGNSGAASAGGSQTATPFAGFDFAQLTQLINQSLQAQKTYEATGKVELPTAELNAIMQNGNQAFEQVRKNQEAAEARKKQEEETKKKARKALANRKCPSCGAPFKRFAKVCKKCGETLSKSKWSD